MAGALSSLQPYQAQTTTVLNAKAPTMPEYQATGTATTYKPDDNAMVAKQIEGLLASNSPYMAAARSRAKQQAAGQGLLSSSIAGTAGELGAISAALPIAQQDATTWLTSQRDNADAQNQFALQGNELSNARDLEAYRGALSWADNSRSLDLQRQQLDADSGYRAADLAFRSASTQDDLSLRGRELDTNTQLRRDEMAQDAALRGRQLDITEAGQANDLSLGQQRVELERQQLEQQAAQQNAQAQQNLASEIAAIRKQSAQAQAAIESDPNMTPEAKTKAILELAAGATANIDELIRFSGISLPESWPDWINTLQPQAVTESPINQGGSTAAPAPAPAAPDVPAPGALYDWPDGIQGGA